MARKKQPDELAFHRPDWRRGGASVRFSASLALRQQLLKEIVDLESRLGRTRMTGSGSDLSLAQTYREMIHARKAYYRELDA